MKRENNPLRTLMNIIGAIGGVLSISSLAETWLEDLLLWKSFIVDVVESYQQLVYPAMGFLLGWLPFDIPTWSYDYMVFGAIVSGSFFRSTRIDLWTSDEFDRHFESNLGRRVTSLFALVTAALTMACVWPIYIVLGFIPRAWTGENGRQEMIRFWSWMAATVLGSVILLSINAAV